MLIKPVIPSVAFVFSINLKVSKIPFQYWINLALPLIPA